MIDALTRHEMLRRDLAKAATVFLPLMVEDQPDTAERVRLAVYQIPFALPEKKRKEAECP